MQKIVIGIVKNGLFQRLFPKPCPTAFRLTSTGILDSIPPEHGELNLIEYEESAIAVKGHCDRDWIYSASIVDTGDPIITTLVENVFGRIRSEQPV